jgi:hypothetical protein
VLLDELEVQSVGEELALASDHYRGHFFVGQSTV